MKGDRYRLLQHHVETEREPLERDSLLELRTSESSTKSFGRKKKV